MSLHQTLQTSLEKLNGLKKLIDMSSYVKRIDEIDLLLSANNAWNDQRKAAELGKERTRLADIVDKMVAWEKGIADDIELMDVFGDDAEKEVGGVASERLVAIERFELLQLMKGEYDHCDCILILNAGAGGFDAAEWTGRMLRMYVRWADMNGYQIEMLDEKWSEEHSDKCLDTASIRVFGKPYAMGFLRGETGIHRVIRSSDFNASGLRQTSFVSVLVMPDIDDTIEVEIDEKQLEITGTFAGGPGGQATNRTKSACRLKYPPADVNIVVRMERSFNDNKRTAMKMLKAKLLQIEIEKKNAEKEKLTGNLSEASFGGAQKRTYTIHPYSLVSDKSGYKNANVDRILDGDIQDMLDASLRAKP